MGTLGTVTVVLGLTIAGCAEAARPPSASPASQPAHTGNEASNGFEAPDGRAARGQDRPDPEEIAIEVTDRGFEPSNITIVRNRRVTLSFRLATSRACRRDVLIRLSPQIVLKQRLVLHEPVRMTVGFPEAGTISFSCDRAGKSGTITVIDGP